MMKKEITTSSVLFRISGILFSFSVYKILLNFRDFCYILQIIIHGTVITKTSSLRERKTWAWSWNFAFRCVGEVSAGHCDWLLASRAFQLLTSSASHFWECPGLITCDLFRLKFLFFYVFLLTWNVLSCNSCTFRIEGVSGEVEFHPGFNLV